MAYNSRYSYISMDNPNNSDGSMAKGYPIFRTTTHNMRELAYSGKAYRTSLVMNNNVVATNSGKLNSNWIDDNIDGQQRYAFSSNKLSY